MLKPDLIQQIRRIEIRSRRLVNERFAGAYQSVFKGSGIEFAEVRPYVPGDEIRSIDWNVTARMGQPYIKRYIEERERSVMLLFDASASGDFGSVGRSRRALGAELAAVLAFTATRNNDRVGLLIFSDQVELLVRPRKGHQHVLRLVRDLLVFSPRDRGTDISLALNAAQNALKQRSILFLISDFLVDTAACRAPLYRANHRHDLVAVDLSDPLEGRIPPVGLLALEDAERGELAWADTDSPSWQRAHQARVEEMETQKKALFGYAGVDRIPIRTDQDYAAALEGFFRRRVRRLHR